MSQVSGLQTHQIDRPSEAVRRAGSGIADYVRYLVRRIHCGAGVVDHVVDAAVGVEKDSQETVQLDPGHLRHFESARGMDIGADVEIGVTAHAPGLMRRDTIGYLVGGVAQNYVIPPFSLGRRVVGHLVLEEDGLAALAVPDELVFW